jgi:hypothetical protein
MGADILHHLPLLNVLCRCLSILLTSSVVNGGSRGFRQQVYMTTTRNHCSEPKGVVVCAALSLRIQKVEDTNLGCNTAFPRYFYGSLQFLQAYNRTASQIDYYRFQTVFT